MPFSEIFDTRISPVSTKYEIRRDLAKELRRPYDCFVEQPYLLQDEIEFFINFFLIIPTTCLCIVIISNVDHGRLLD